MLAILYLLVVIASGYTIVSLCLPDILTYNIANNSPYKLKTNIPRYIIGFPACFLVGIVFSTWLTYILCYLFAGSGRGMSCGTMVSMLIMVVFVAFYLFIKIKHVVWAKPIINNTKSYILLYKTELLLSLFLILYSAWLIFFSFHVTDGGIFMGHSVFSDLGPHVSMIRSFSLGENFPTQYPYFPDGTIRYHFLFHFATGVLEYLGMRIDIAFNLLSILSIASCCLLLYALAVFITNRKAAGVLAVFLMFFRPSIAGFSHIADNAPYEGVRMLFVFIAQNSGFIGDTAHDDWGLWATPNVFANQRHLPFAIGVLLLVIIYMLPLSIEMVKSLRKHKDSVIKEWVISLDAWIPRSIVAPVFIGVLIGLLGYFNGAATIALLSILFLCALIAKRRLEFLIIAVISVLIVVGAGAFFASGVSLVSPKYFFGFIADNKTLIGVISYLSRLVFVLPVLVMATVIQKPKSYALPAFVFSAPAIIAFTLSLTPEIAVNHKYVFITIALLNILAAECVMRLYSRKKGMVLLNKIAAIMLIIALATTGLFDHAAIVARNNKNARIRLETNDETQSWILENTNYGDVFASHIHWLSPVMLAGRFLYMGWPYYPWGAGYDTYARDYDLRSFFASQTSAELINRADEMKLNYILVDPPLLYDSEYEVNKGLISQTFDLVFSDPATGTEIYAVP